MTEYPQVVLFGTIPGNWREDHIIPVLDELGVSYFNPVAPAGWTKAHGDHEAELMAHCETIIMVFNKRSPSFTALAEAGWAALGAYQRGQNFIMQIELEYKIKLPASVRALDEGKSVEQMMQHWLTSSRHLVYNHAKAFDIETMHIVDDLQGVVDKLRQIYKQ